MEIRTNQDYEEALDELGKTIELYDEAELALAEMRKDIRVLADTIEAYEEKHWPIPEPSAEDMAEFLIDQGIEQTG